MKKLIKDIINFRAKSLKEYRNKFAKLSKGQSPDALLISCCDSRVVPNIFTSQDPGDLFILRNIGNLVPPYQTNPIDNSVTAAIEYAVLELEVPNIIICGHSECGAMSASLEKELPTNYRAIKTWLEYAKPAQQKLQQGFLDDANLTPENRLSQINVVQQLEHLRSYPYVAERLKKEGLKPPHLPPLKIHGWWFDIATANVYYYEPKSKKFLLIDDPEFSQD